VNNLTHISD